MWRYPVKSAGGEQLDALDVTEAGVVGDRRWAVADDDGTLVSAKHPRRGGRLLLVHCRYDDNSGTTTLDVPGSGTTTAGSREADDAVSTLLGRPATLTNQPVPGQRLRRWWPSEPDLIPEWQHHAAPAEDAVTTVAGPQLRQSFVDYGAVHVIVRADLERLSTTAGIDIDPLRFRPNVLVEGIDELRVGARLRIGSADFDVELPTPRCAVPGLSPADTSLDPQLLHVLARHDRRQVRELGTAACFGVYATRTTSATIRAGDEVRVQ